MIDDKSFKYMPFWLSFVSFINAGIWTAYSLIYIIDIHLLICYALGTSLCALQILVHAFYYYRTTRSRHMCVNENDAT
ncbi:Bidirectional sugar transporter SWEET8 [Cardamine amara subsp. amara]|uniref:Bidirectional sugar transporter SWEET8 n=1 Tax=Cardamine amara subsp. amara TaxID=228776 RepID=A0ABD1AS18_CARAN